MLYDNFTAEETERLHITQNHISLIKIQDISTYSFMKKLEYKNYLKENT